MLPSMNAADVFFFAFGRRFRWARSVRVYTSFCMIRDLEETPFDPNVPQQDRTDELQMQMVVHEHEIEEDEHCCPQVGGLLADKRI